MVLPKAIQMGVRVSEFWDLTMNELYAIEKAYKQMKKDEYRYHEKVLRIMPGDNPGVTILVLKELY